MLKCVLGFCLPKDYQKLESPTPDGAVHVDINVEILDILSVNDKEFSITMSMYFREFVRIFFSKIFSIELKLVEKWRIKVVVRRKSHSIPEL